MDPNNKHKGREKDIEGGRQKEEKGKLMVKFDKKFNFKGPRIKSKPTILEYFLQIPKIKYLQIIQQ